MDGSTLWHPLVYVTSFSPRGNFPGTIPLFVLFFVLFCFVFWPHHSACGTLVPGPGIKPTSPALEGFNLWVGKSPWRRKWQPTPVFLPGESCGQRILVGYSPWGHKEWTRLGDNTALEAWSLSHWITREIPNSSVSRCKTESQRS